MISWISKAASSVGDIIKGAHASGLTLWSSASALKLKSVNYTMTLPTTGGAAGTALCENGSGGTTFAQIGTAGLADGAVTSEKLAFFCVDYGNLIPNAVKAAIIEDGAVLEQKINDDAVTTFKIADGNVTSAKISDRTALSVFGRSSNSSGVGADIAAGSDDQVLRRSGTSIGFGTVATGGLADGAVTPAKQSSSARTGHRIYKTITGDTTLASSDWTDSGVAYDPAQSELIVTVNGTSGTITVTAPSDSAAVPGCRFRVVKGNSNSFACSVAAASIQTISDGTTGTANTAWTTTASIGLSAGYEYSGISWLWTGIGKRAQGMAASALNAVANCVFGKSLSSAGAGETITIADGYVLGTTGTTTGQTKVDDAHSAFVSADGKRELVRISAGAPQNNTNLTTTSTETYNYATTTNREHDLVFESRFSISSVPYVLRYWARYKNTSGTVTVVASAPVVGPTTYSPPPSVTLSASASTTNAQYNLLQNSGVTITDLRTRVISDERIDPS